MKVHYLTGNEEKEMALCKRAMKFWSISASIYRQTELLYQDLMKEKSSSSIGRKYRNLPKSVLMQKPQIEFFWKESESEAMEYLWTLSLSEKRALIRQLESLSHNYSYNTFRAYVTDLNHVMRGKGKSPLGINPESSGSQFALRASTHRVSRELF